MNWSKFSYHCYIRNTDVRPEDMNSNEFPFISFVVRAEHNRKYRCFAFQTEADVNSFLDEVGGWRGWPSNMRPILPEDMAAEVLEAHHD